MKKTDYLKLTTTLMMTMFIILSGCKKDDEKPKDDKFINRTVTLLAAMPAQIPSSGTLPEKSEGSLNSLTKWKAGDKITTFVVQGETKVKVSESTVSDISEDGRSCSFKITVPEEIDVSASFDLYAFYGIPGRGVQLTDGEILVDITPLKGISSDKLQIPVWSKSGKISLPSENIKLTFNHLGAYEVIHFRNSNDQAVEVLESYLIPESSGSPLWYHQAETGSIPVFNPVTDRITTVSGNSVSQSASGIIINPYTTKTLVSWYVPNGNNIPQVGLKIDEDTAVNTKEAKNFAMQPGKAYHVYAIQDCAKTVLTDDEYETEFPELGTGVEVELKYGMEITEEGRYIYTSSSGITIYFLLPTVAGQNALIYMDQNYPVPFSFRFWGELYQNGAEYYPQYTHEQVNGKHIKDRKRVNGVEFIEHNVGRTIISPDGLKLKMSALPSTNLIKSVTIFDHGVVQYFNAALNIFEYSDYNSDFANYLDAIQPDGETSTYNVENNELILYNIHFEKYLCEKIVKRLDLASIPLDSHNTINKLYVDGTNYP